MDVRLSEQGTSQRARRIPCDLEIGVRTLSGFSDHPHVCLPAVRPQCAELYRYPPWQLRLLNIPPSNSRIKWETDKDIYKVWRWRSWNDNNFVDFIKVRYKIQWCPISCLEKHFKTFDPLTMYPGCVRIASTHFKTIMYVQLRRYFMDGPDSSSIS